MVALVGDMVVVGMRAVEFDGIAAVDGSGQLLDGYLGWGMEKVMGFGEYSLLPAFVGMMAC